MVLSSVIVYLVLNGVTTAAKIKGNFQCTKHPEDPVCSRNALPAVKNGSFECNSTKEKMSSLRIGDVCSMKCDKGFYRIVSNHTICERGSHDQEGHWSDGIFECHECINWAEWNGNMYRFISSEQDLEESEMICQEQPFYVAHLVYIEDEDENDFITNMIFQCNTLGSAWIGLSDKEEEGVWKWGEQNAEYLNWGAYDGRDEPNGKRTENYAIINYYGTGKWYDVPSDWMFHAVCEKEM